MVEFAERFPDRYYDVRHRRAACGDVWQRVWPAMALKPVVAIYSTFLQRGYDQLIHDVALQNLM